MKTRCNIDAVVMALAVSLAGGGPARGEPRAISGTAVVTMLFRQPSVEGIEGRLYVQSRVPWGEFAMISWQRNPWTENGGFVPVDWDVGGKTGFDIAGNRTSAQRGMRNVMGSTAAQMMGDQVGAYLNSADLTRDGLDAGGRPLPGSEGYKMMVTPQVRFDPAGAIHPFRSDGGSIHVALDLQIPVAACAERKGSLAYANPVLVLVDPRRKVKISYVAGLFSKRSREDPARHVHHVAYDGPSKSWMIHGRLLPGNRWVTVADGSATYATSPWSGWRRFAYAITRANFEDALRELRERQPETGASTDPSDYVLQSFHLNAEITYETAPSEMGWSMRGATVAIADAAPASSD